MLSKPWCGWTKVTINNEDMGSASYLDWIPGLVLEPCIRYLKICKEMKDTYGYISGGYGFNIEFDGEDRGHFGIVEIGNDLYLYDYSDPTPPYLKLKEIDLKDFGYNSYKFIYHLTKEVVSDIESNYEDWILWDTMTNDKEEYDMNKEALDKILKEAKAIIVEFDTPAMDHSMELGNLLFGNSRGEFPIFDRENWQDTFWEYFGDYFDYHAFYDNAKKDPKHTTDMGGYENDTFVINPYYWGEDDEIAKRPNFIYKPTGLEIQWYKYPLRDAYLNQDISLEEAKKIWADCIKSMEVN